MTGELRATVREQTGGRFEVLGELASDEHGAVVCLGRDGADQSLVAITITRDGTRPDGSGQYSVQVLPELADSVVSISSACGVCGSVVDSEPVCGVCGSSIDSPGVSPLSGYSATAAMRAVREAAGGAFEVLGEMPRAGGSGALYFAREIATGRVVALSLRNAIDENGGEFLSLGVTRIVKRPSATEGSRPTFPQTGGEGMVSVGANRAASRDASVPEGPVKICPTCSRSFPPETRFCPADGATLLAVGTDQSLIGRTIAERYHILELIGEGGFGKVYLAEHARMGRRCAVKIINPSMRNDVDVVGRFSREAANASRISHANIATVYDFGESADGLIYLVMEYVAGETLAQTLAREKPLPAWRAAEIARQIADALIAAHGLGIVHRDLKPQNIILTRGHDGGELVKVVDFGIAKAVQGDSQEITRTGFVIGTLEYMSPEQLLGTTVDGRSDVYSLGCVLFEMLTGQSAFAGPDGPISIGRRMSEAPSRVRDRNADIPRELDEVVAMALAHDPAERFQTAEGLRDALDGILRGGTAERLGLIRRTTAETVGGIQPPVTGAAPRNTVASADTPAPQPRIIISSETATAATAAPPALAHTGAGPSVGSTSEPHRASSRRVTTSIVVGTVLVAAAVGGYRVLTAGERGSAMVPTSHVAPSATTIARGTAGDASGDPAESATIHIGGSVPGDAVVTIDGEVHAERPVALAPGVHQIRVTAAGYFPIDTVLTAASAQVINWSPTMRPDGATGSTATTTPSPASQTASPRTTPATTGAPVTGVATAVPALVVEPPASVAATPSAPSGGRDAPPPVPTSAAAADSRERIVAELDRFARALESRRIEAVAVAYPGITPSERTTWAGFIGGVRNLSVAIADVRIPTAIGETVLVPFSMRFNFTDQRGTNQSTQRYQATFVQLAGDWRIEAIRPE